MEERGAGEEIYREGSHTPGVDFLTHPLSNSLGGGFSPCEDLLQVTRGMPSLVGTYMQRTRARARHRPSKGGGKKGREKGEGTRQPHNFIPFLTNQPHISIFLENTGFHEYRSLVMKYNGA